MYRIYSKRVFDHRVVRWEFFQNTNPSPILLISSLKSVYFQICVGGWWFFHIFFYFFLLDCPTPTGASNFSASKMSSKFRWGRAAASMLGVCSSGLLSRSGCVKFWFLVVVLVAESIALERSVSQKCFWRNHATVTPSRGGCLRHFRISESVNDFPEIFLFANFSSFSISRFASGNSFRKEGKPAAFCDTLMILSFFSFFLFPILSLL